MPRLVYKVPGGKLLKVDLETDENGIITDVVIRGDFFLYPEDSLGSVEDFLRGRKFDTKWAQELAGFLTDNDIEVFGFSAQDLWDCINNA